MARRVALERLIAITLCAVILVSLLAQQSEIVRRAEIRSGTLASTRASDVNPATFIMSADGLTPTVIGLAWSGGPGIWYNDYYVYMSTSSSGPWSLIGGAYTTASAYFVDGLSPSTTYYFWANDSYLTGYDQTPVITAMTPAASVLTYTPISTTSVQLAWTNLATYSSLVAFSSYIVYQKSGSGAWQNISYLTNESQTMYTVTGLPPGSSESYYVDTVASCPTCSSVIYWGSDSNEAGAQTLLPLTVTISGDRPSVDVGQSDTFTASAAGGEAAYTYSWSTTSGTQGTGATFATSFASTGSYTVTVVVTDSLGDRSTQAVSVSVSPALSVAISIPSNSLMVGQSLTFSASVSGGSGGFTYQWAFGDGSTSTSASPSHAYSKSGTFTVYLAVTDSNGNSVQASPQTVTVNNAGLVPGLTPTDSYIVLGVLVAIVLVAIAVVLTVVRRRRSRGGKTQATGPNDGPSG